MSRDDKVRDLERRAAASQCLGTAQALMDEADRLRGSAGERRPGPTPLLRN